MEVQRQAKPSRRDGKERDDTRDENAEQPAEQTTRERNTKLHAPPVGGGVGDAEHLVGLLEQRLDLLPGLLHLHVGGFFGVCVFIIYVFICVDVESVGAYGCAYMTTTNDDTAVNPSINQSISRLSTFTFA